MGRKYLGQRQQVFVELPNVKLQENESNNVKTRFCGEEENTHIEFSDIYF